MRGEEDRGAAAFLCRCAFYIHLACYFLWHAHGHAYRARESGVGNEPRSWIGLEPGGLDGGWWFFATGLMGDRCLWQGLV